jgi:riboflavin synthase
MICVDLALSHQLIPPGHTVSGHISCTAIVSEVKDLENNTRKLTFELPDDKWMKYILSKGFIAVNGCSLTIGDVVGRTFCVWLIPETLRVTVFGSIQAGESVNVEIESQTQAIVDTVERVLASKQMIA